MKKIIKSLFIGSMIISLVAVIWKTSAQNMSFVNTTAWIETIINEQKQDVDKKVAYNDAIMQPKDSIPQDSTKLRFPFKDNTHDIDEEYSSPMYLQTPSNYSMDYEYDYKNNEYRLVKKVGNMEYMQPVILPENEFKKYDFDKSLENYWREKARSESPTGRSKWDFSLPVQIAGFNEIFGSNKIDIRPTGDAELIFGVNITRTENPALPLNLQRQITFDFDEKINMGVTGKIGDKVELGINYNTKATFDFQNKTKLAYEGKEDEIIKLIEAGNVSLPLRGTLISGGQNLFGFKTQLQFGRLTATSIISQQKGQRSELTIEGGSRVKDFEVSAGDYDANRHFFLSHYFKENYDNWMSNLPLITSGITISKIEVWVTNRTNVTENNRNIIALMDLAEANPDNVYGNPTDLGLGSRMPSNTSNKLYSDLVFGHSGIRDVSTMTDAIKNSGLNLEGGENFEKIERAKRLSSSEYQLNSQLGYISLNSALNADEVLAVAFEYTTGDGQVYRVGEFSDGEFKSPKTLVLKLIKGTSLSPNRPNWGLMMKNIYSLGAYRVNREDFMLNVLYKDDETGSEINYITNGRRGSDESIPKNLKGKLFLQVMNLDQLNSQNEPSPDGMFDFVDGVTILANKGKVIFPVLEPFGEHLEKQILETNPNDVNLISLAERYVFRELYDSTQNKALQLAEKNKFLVKGVYKGEGGSEIMLDAMSLVAGSIKVTSGGITLIEGVDYTVGSNSISIINEGYLQSERPINISYEDQANFNMTSKTLLGTHLDYRVSENFTLGGTIMRLSEKPLTSKVNYGMEPISNTIWGFDGAYTTEAPFLTRMVDRLPFIETKEKSTITIEGEFAQLVPGHSKALKKAGQSFIDDFEGSEIPLELKSLPAWHLSSVPQVMPEAKLNNDLACGYNRAKIAWYNVSNDYTGKKAPGHISVEDRSEDLVREVIEQEISPNLESEHGISARINVLNVAYYPDEKGPYNYDVEGSAYSKGIDSDGKLNDPSTRWAGIMRQLTTTDFEEHNIEFIEFWVMDPFDVEGGNPNHDGGELLINIGNVSEDILKDGRKAFEHRLDDNVDTTAWGIVPITQPIVDNFDNNPETRRKQDVGLDGLSDEEERIFFSSQGRHDYLDRIGSLFSVNSLAYLNAYRDPSNDTYPFFKGNDYDPVLGILERYKENNGMEHSSPVSDDMPDENYLRPGNTLPDQEDINRDKTLNENESYYQYRVKLTPEDLVVGKNYIVDKITNTQKRIQGDASSESTVHWYQFRIPVFEATGRETVGNIQDFKSMRFMRLVLKDFNEKVVLRFGEFRLIKGEWRKYLYDLSAGGPIVTTPQLTGGILDISAVNIEENSAKSPVNYVLPPDVDREIDPNNTNVQQLNEQSIVLKALELGDGEAKAAYKSENRDLRQFKSIRMYAHAEAIEDCSDLEDYEVTAFIRLGSDFKENYYEYEVPLKLTLPGSYDNENLGDRYLVWPEENNFIVDLDQLQKLKINRNKIVRAEGSTLKTIQVYTETIEGRDPGVDGKDDIRISVKGNPNMSNIGTIMLGVRNPHDDGEKKCAEVWLNELRLTDFRENGGWAANARVSANLADFATISVAGSTSKAGFGSIDKKINERQKEDIYRYDVASNIELGKFFPKKANVRIPLFVEFSENMSNPQYNPLDPDILLKDLMNDPEISKDDKKEIKKQAQDYTRRKSVNFTNVKINSQKTAKPRFYNVSNFSTGFAWNETYSRNMYKEYDISRQHAGNITYNFNNRPKAITPFQRVKGLNRVPLLGSFNFYLAPQQIGFSTSLDKRYSTMKVRNVSNPDFQLQPSFRKDFIWDRKYILNYKISKGLKLTFDALNLSRIDEPDGWLERDSSDYSYKRDSIWNNMKTFGRTTNYRHKFTLNYVVPINQIPGFKWINMDATYAATYDWNAGLRDPIVTNYGHKINSGNTIRNSNNKQLQTTFNFDRIYKKSKYLKSLSVYDGTGAKKKKTETVEWTTTLKGMKAQKSKTVNHKLKSKNVKIKAFVNVEIELNGKKENRRKAIIGKTEVIDDNKVKFTVAKDYDEVEIEVSGSRDVKDNPIKIAGDMFAYMITGVKNISVRYSEQNGTSMPGYGKNTSLLGMVQTDGQFAPGWPFVLGFQDDDFAQKATENRWLVSEESLSNPYAMTHSTNLNIQAKVRPLPGLDINLTAQRTESSNFTEYYTPDQFSTNVTGKNERKTGSFSRTILSVKTAFEKLGEGPDYSSAYFEKFKQLRFDVANRLADERTVIDPDNYNRNDVNPDPSSPTNEILYGNDYFDPREVESATNPRYVAYPKGYSPLSEEVLIPAFIAAYTGKSADEVSLNVVPSENDPFLERIMKTFPMPNWKVKYDGLSKMPFIKQYFKTFIITHSYQSTYSVSSFQTPMLNPFDGEGTSLSELFIPQYETQGVSIKEVFSPLVKVSMTMQNSFTGNFEIRKSRDLRLSFSNNELADRRSDEFVVGVGYIIPKKYMKISINNKDFESDLKLRADLRIKDDTEVRRRLDYEEDHSAQAPGTRRFSLTTSADYRLNERFNLRLYYDHTINEPKIQTGYRTSNVKFGVNIRFTLIP